MRIGLLVFLLGLATVGTAAAEGLHQPPLLGDQRKAQQVWDVVVKWTGAYKKRDLKGVMDTFDPEEVFTFYGAKNLSYADLESGYRAEFAKETTAKDGEWVTLADEVYAEGKTAFVRGVAELQVKGADGSVSVTERNRCIDVYRLKGAGQWKIFRTMCYPDSKK